MKVLVDLFAEENGIMQVCLEVTVSGGDYSRWVQHLWVGDSSFYFHGVMATNAVYEFRGEALEVVENRVRLEARHVVDALGSEAAAKRLARIAGECEPVLSPVVWREVFRELPTPVAVSMAVADVRLVPHLSPEARVLYAAEHSDLMEAGALL